MKHYDTFSTVFSSSSPHGAWTRTADLRRRLHVSFSLSLEYLQAANADWRGDLRGADDQRRFFQHDFAGFDVPGCDIMSPDFVVVAHTHRRTLDLVCLPILLLVLRRTIKNLQATGATRFACFIAHEAVSCSGLGPRSHHSTVKATLPDKNFFTIPLARPAGCAENENMRTASTS